MFLNAETYPNLNKLYQNGYYSVIVNTIAEDYDKIDKKEDTHLPNYLVVHDKTLAIEYAIDQLPAAIQVANKLADELENQLEHTERQLQ